MRHVLSALLLLSTASIASAQERTIARAGLPRDVETRLIAIIEDPATRRVTGAETIAGEHAGNFVVFNGPLTLSGRIQGELIVVDGIVTFEAGSSVTGDVTLVGAEATGIDHADVGGTITSYGEGFSLFRGGKRVFSTNSRNRHRHRDGEWQRDWGHSSFTVRTGWNYNRVEGLPVHFGPTIETGGRNPTRVEAHAIWRTEVSSPWDTDDLGYQVSAEQFLGGRRELRAGVSLRSVIEPIESWQFTRTESSLSTFLLHQDHSDYFQREGWSAYLKYAARGSGLSATVAYRDEEHSTQPARDPWTLFNNNDAWRLQPQIGDGTLRSINTSVQLDRRNDEDFPSGGFLLRGEVTHGLDGDLGRYEENFTTGLIDARVYRRVGADATLSFRLVGAGALNDVALAPQFQHALGGAGSLPGYSTFSADCGARSSAIIQQPSGDAFYPYYGCDRTALFSAEYRGGFDFHIGTWEEEDSDDDWDWDMDAHPNWIVFFDAGRGWSKNGTDTANLYDVGAGILLGDLGIYGALPLTGEDRDIRFFVRIGPRF